MDQAIKNMVTLVSIALCVAAILILVEPIGLIKDGLNETNKGNALSSVMSAGTALAVSVIIFFWGQGIGAKKDVVNRTDSGE